MDLKAKRWDGAMPWDESATSSEETAWGLF